MICLYTKNETAFSDNGVCELDPTVCTVSEKTAGSYELYMEHPIDKHNKYSLIECDMIIEAPVPKNVIPAITLPASTKYTVGQATDFYKKLPVYKNTTQKDQILVTIRANPSLYAYRTSYAYNVGSYCIYGDYIYRAKRFLMSVTPWTDASAWGVAGPLVASGPTYERGEVYSPALSVGDYVTKVATYDATYIQVRDTLNRLGYIKLSALTVSSTVSETIPEQTIERQRFRIYQVESDEDSRIIKVYAKHISYDFQGNSLMACDLTEASPADAIAILQGVLMIADDRRIACEFTEETITKDWSFKNPINALLDTDNGLVPKLSAMLIRNNDDFYILKNDNPRTGITIERGVNMSGVTWNYNTESSISRVVPRCRNGDDEYLYLEHGGTWTDPSSLIDDNWQQNDDIYVESASAASFPKQKIEVLDCNFSVGETYTPVGETTETKRTEQSCREEMLKKAKERFTVDNCDAPEITLTVEFVLLGDTEEYSQYRNLQRVNLYDKVTVKSELIESTAQVTEYEFNCLTKRYNSITVGNVSSFKKRIPGCRVVNESITYAKLSPDLVNRIRTMNGSSSSDSGSSGTSPTGGSVSLVTEVIDSLTSTSTESALSANQGRILNEKLQLSNITSLQVIEDSGHNMLILRGNYEGTGNYLQLIINGNTKQLQIAKAVNGTETTMATFQGT